MSKARDGAHQTRPWPPSGYEVKLARTLEGIYGSGVHDLPGVVAALQEATVSSPEGTPWTEESFVAAMRTFGA